MTSPRAPLFILAPPLGLGAHLAACLARHPGFASLPAVQMMCGATPADLAARWGDRLRDPDHGLIRAVAALITGDAQAACDWLQSRHDMPTAQIFAALQSAAAPRRLIDASFLYPVDDSALDRIAQICPEARFIHFLRHPATQGPVARVEALWLRPHLRIHAFLARQPATSWVRLRVEALAAHPAPLLAGMLDWLGEDHEPDILARLLNADIHPEHAVPGPALAPHGVDPALVADPRLQALLAAPAAPEFDDAAWDSAGFDSETRAMARLFGYL